MNDAVGHKNGIDSAAEQSSKDISHGQVVGYIDPVKEAKMMRKFDVRNFAKTYSINLSDTNLRQHSSGQLVSSAFSTCWQILTGQWSHERWQHRLNHDCY